MGVKIEITYSGGFEMIQVKHLVCFLAHRSAHKIGSAVIITGIQSVKYPLCIISGTSSKTSHLLAAVCNPFNIGLGISFYN